MEINLVTEPFTESRTHIQSYYV